VQKYRVITQIGQLYREAPRTTRQSGCAWYIDEHRNAARLAKRARRPLRIVCACLAVLSPRCQWPRVKIACDELLSGRAPRGLLPHNVVKAQAILDADNTAVIDPVTAPKTWAFWRNLWKPNDPEPVTLDSWMLRAHRLPLSVGLRTYEALAEAYRSVAADLGLIPNQLQAVVWLHIKHKFSCANARPNGKQFRQPHPAKRKERV
jgi:hypothetical protein